MEFIKIGNVINLVSGRDLNKGQYNDSSKGIPYIMGASNMDRGVLQIERWTEEPTVLGLKGDIVMSVKGTVGELLILEEEKVHLSRQVMSIRVNGEIDKEYMFFYLRYYVEKLKEKAKGMIPGITREDILQADFAYMDLSEQKKVVECLTRAEGLVNKRKKQIDACDELIKSQFIEMFGNPIRNEKGWNTSRLEDVCDGIGDGLHGTPVYDSEGKYPFINGTNLMDGKVVITPNTLYVNEEQYNKHYIKLTKNSILISINGTLGKLAFYEGEEVILGKSACYCNLKEDINKQFVYAVMKNDAFLHYITGAATASTIKNVSLKTMRNFELIIPPIELQNQFAKFVQQVDKLKFDMQQSLIELENNFNALMQRAFKGELF